MELREERFPLAQKLAELDYKIQQIGSRKKIATALYWQNKGR